MTMRLLIVIAVALPFVVFATFWAFSKFMVWSGPRPRTRGYIYLAFGIAYLPLAIWNLWYEGVRFGNVVLALAGVLWIYLAINELRRGQVINFE